MKPRGAIPRLNNCSNCSGDAWFFCHFCKSDLCYRCNDNHDCQMKDFDHLFTITDNKDLYIERIAEKDDRRFRDKKEKHKKINGRSFCPSVSVIIVHVLFWTMIVYLVTGHLRWTFHGAEH
ncbi:uncharacterized protein LOC111116821 [Crassostrea virginica]